ncbi:DUF2569 domain-containing protein [Sphingomonas sp. BN140010]|uniref:DUF2569 domain-containing protein n=1 Tax=Sphingomonas arvum TaxID=2992113 RepID=A0ABT3JEC8_9SPHN|nr:DUF2569 domain-containing protein [Sphingomonas sp. BN140010]MCW3797171.1 DUF2569 domain-containing protein [Sphingomonas sp. BN140010]
MIWSRLSQRYEAKAAAVLATLETRFDRFLIGWLLLAGLAATARVATSPPIHGPVLGSVLPYILLVFAPVVSVLLARRWFADGDRQPQPEHRLARVGQWRDVGRAEARCHPLYGTKGIMVSLLVGILLNIPVRAMEYLGSIPAISGPVPTWLLVLHTTMSLDVVLLTSLYAVAFVAALHRVPLFPRLLAAIWGVDLLMQLVAARLIGATPGLPATVAAPLHDMLHGNVTKVLISIGVWLPYLLLSKRVNVTYRSRVAA